MTQRYDHGDRVVVERFIFPECVGHAGRVDWYYGDVDAYGGKNTYAVTIDRPVMGSRFIRISEYDISPEELR